MCRRNYPTDVCNRGTAGKFVVLNNHRNTKYQNKTKNFTNKFFFIKKKKFYMNWCCCSLYWYLLCSTFFFLFVFVPIILFPALEYLHTNSQLLLLLLQLLCGFVAIYFLYILLVYFASTFFIIIIYFQIPQYKPIKKKYKSNASSKFCTWLKIEILHINIIISITLKLELCFFFRLSKINLKKKKRN